MKKWYLYILPVMVFVLFTACSVKKVNTEKLRDVEFTVVNPSEVPEELRVQIESGGKEPFKFTYGDAGYLYMARGYGQRQTSGYSVEVTACYEAEDAICVDTTLLGPEKGEEIQQKPTCPYVVIKTEYTDKNVIFD